MKHFAVLTVMLVAMAACSNALPPAEGVRAADGFDVRVFASGFDGPTQMVWASDGELLIAELNGAENDATGRILRVSADDFDNRVVLQDGLDKPTGIAVAGDRLWIMERRRLSVTTLDPGAPRQIVADDMAFNGRSQGTLTMTAEGSLLYNTSGAKRGPTRTSGSGILFAIDDAASGPTTPRVIAEGFKHAYAHLVDDDDQIWSVEMTDGNFDGERAADELLAISVGDDAGWPQCVDDNRPVAEYGGNTQLCSQSPRSHALFGVGATPTSLIISPWDSQVFLATLWLPGEVVAVPRTAPTSDSPHTPEIFIDGIESPQHLLRFNDDLLVSDHETGRLLLVRSTSD